MAEYQHWKHIFKLDPNKDLTDEDLEAICESGTDAIMVGGTDGVTLDNTLQLLVRVRRYAVPCVLEISNTESITPGFDYFFIPTVLNSQKTEWITGHHHTALKEYGAIMNWDEIIPEGYCILNPEAKVAQLTDAKSELDAEDVLAYARMAEQLYKLPIFYIEYSGTYGDPNIVKQASSVLEKTRLFYGGGIKSSEQAEEMAAYADTIVVGDVIYEDLKQALKTVHAVKGDLLS
ncbi:heptaprenylglyceryl phosphate synthase [Alkalicoccobacillus murimartini]|uniref:Heptaprenylglyceryl phosphate synthase n=1 Tax=Alkalicoccobacillus murimartini TaxID=171685 RepID=A0ABT9YKN8_9BACI|nr:heptaprenylglyceryl phosphate synthase [Alkalicoccobacillus murimartini]MDQ0208435.1 putative glycerol-1-phosphate prenyltransferase [Alkalicoccobacillus murimartini]